MIKINFIFAIFIFVVVIAFAEGAGFQQTCKQNTDCTSVTGDIVCDVRPPIPTFTCLYKGGITCSQYMDCANNLNCSGVNVVNVTTNGICGCDAAYFFYDPYRTQCIPLGGFGSFCLSSSNCEKGFSCSFGRCLLGNLKPCSSSNDCASLICFKGNCLGLNLGK